MFSEFGIMMRLFTSCSLVSLLCVATLVLVGCMSDRQANNISYSVTEQMFGRTMDIPFWTDALRRDKGRLPHDFTELSRFVSRQTGSRVQLTPCTRVDFALLPSGQRQAE